MEIFCNGRQEILLTLYFKKLMVRQHGKGIVLIKDIIYPDLTLNLVNPKKKNWQIYAITSKNMKQ